VPELAPLPAAPGVASAAAAAGATAALSGSSSGSGAGASNSNSGGNGGSGSGGSGGNAGVLFLAQVLPPSSTRDASRFYIPPTAALPSGHTHVFGPAVSELLLEAYKLPRIAALLASAAPVAAAPTAPTAPTGAGTDADADAAAAAVSALASGGAMSVAERERFLYLCATRFPATQLEALVEVLAGADATEAAAGATLRRALFDAADTDAVADAGAGAEAGVETETEGSNALSSALARVPRWLTPAAALGASASAQVRRERREARRASALHRARVAGHPAAGAGTGAGASPAATAVANAYASNATAAAAAARAALAGGASAATTNPLVAPHTASSTGALASAASAAAAASSSALSATAGSSASANSRASPALPALQRLRAALEPPVIPLSADGAPAARALPLEAAALDASLLVAHRRPAYLSLGECVSARLVGLLRGEDWQRVLTMLAQARRQQVPLCGFVYSEMIRKFARFGKVDHVTAAAEAMLDDGHADVDALVAWVCLAAQEGQTDCGRTGTICRRWVRFYATRQRAWILRRWSRC
jgi:hypothetical protein